MHEGIAAFLTSSTFGFVLNLLAGLGAATFGILGIGANTRDDAGHLRREGKIALIGILVSTMIGGVSTVYDFETAQKTAAVERRKSDRLRLEPLRAALPAGCVLDGKMVIVKNDGIDFDALHCVCIPLSIAKKSTTSQGS